MKIVLLGNADSIWMKEYIEHVLLDEEEVIVISRENQVYSDWYEKQNIMVKACGASIFDRKPIIYNWLLFNRKIKKEIGRCDVLHVQFVDIVLLLRCIGILSNAKRIIYTFWGSDLLRASFWARKGYIPFLKKADRIVLMTKAMQSSFIELYGKTFNDRLKVLDFGNPGYESISTCVKKMTKEECKTYWGIDKDKIVAPIGYNGNKEQQHLDIVEQLGRVPKTILERFTFVFHFGYGNSSKEYYEKIIKMAEEKGLDYIVINRFLNKNEIAILRLCADVFLYGQTSDAMSGSVLEYAYAGCNLVMPTWLDYSALDEVQIPYVKYESFDEIPRIITDFSSRKITRNENNRDILWNLNSWQVLAPKWYELYGRITSKNEYAG